MFVLICILIFPFGVLYGRAPRSSTLFRHINNKKPPCGGFLLFGGDGESRTRVRKHFHRSFSERS